MRRFLHPIGRALAAIADGLRPMPVVLRCMTVGAGLGGAIGGTTGLVVGLGHPATAWFAVLEVGIPGTIVGSICGVIVGTLAAAVSAAWRRLKRHRGGGDGRSHGLPGKTASFDRYGGSNAGPVHYEGAEDSGAR